MNLHIIIVIRKLFCKMYYMLVSWGISTHLKSTVDECKMKRCVCVCKSHRCLTIIRYHNFKGVQIRIYLPLLASRSDPGYFKEQRVYRLFVYSLHTCKHSQSIGIERTNKSAQIQSRKILYEILSFILFILLSYGVWYYMQIFKMETCFYFHSLNTKSHAQRMHVCKKRIPFFSVVYVFAHSNQCVCNVYKTFTILSVGVCMRLLPYSSHSYRHWSKNFFGLKYKAKVNSITIFSVWVFVCVWQKTFSRTGGKYSIFVVVHYGTFRQRECSNVDVDTIEVRCTQFGCLRFVSSFEGGTLLKFNLNVIKKCISSST